MITKKNADHCVMRGNVMTCRRCGTERPVKMPVPISEFTKTVSGFIREHQDCKPAESTKGGAV
jgi:hypothetical protein